MYNYLESLVNSYKLLGYNYYLIYYNDVENSNTLEITKSDIVCYFAKSQILQNSNYIFTVEDECVKVILNYNTILNENLNRQNTILIVEEFEEVQIPQNSYVYTNSVLLTGTELVYNIYPSFLTNSDIKTNTNLDFTNFILVLLFVTVFIVLIFKKLIFGG